MPIGMLQAPAVRDAAANDSFPLRERARLPGEQEFAEELLLWRRYARTRDPASRGYLIERYLPLCRAIAASLYGRRYADDAEFGDYLQCATLGLIEAVDSFDCNRGVRFNTFATYRIQGAIRNCIANFSERREQAALLYRLKKERLAADDGTAMAALTFLLEDCGLLAGENEAQYVEHFYDGVELRELKQWLVAAVEALPQQERRVIAYHYFQNLEFTEIARILSLSKGRISQIHKHALALLCEARALLAS